MLQVPFIRENKNLLIERLQVRNISLEEAQALVQKILNADDERRQAQTTLDANLAKANVLSKEIGALYKSGKRAEAEEKKTAVAAMKDENKVLELKMKDAEHHRDKLLLTLPNIPHPTVPPGHTDEDNEVYQAFDGELPKLDDDALPHWELAKKYSLFDLELGAKITGAGFPLYRGKGAKLQRGLINFFLDEATKSGYEEIIPPLIVNHDSARGTGQLPDKEGQMYEIQEDNLFLIPTAEVPITNMLRDVILNEADFPIKLAGHTPCFRREAGSYGADVRGLNRVHQFDKVEIVQVAHPDKSYDVLQEMLEHVKNLLEKLELPYRIVRLCGGDLGFTSALTFDFEVYSAAQKRWLEVSSVSNFETFQSNRLKLRYKDKNNKKHLAHTLNGSALALARIVAALLENNQSADGIRLPKALHSYCGMERI